MYRQWVLELWRKRELAARRKAHNPPRLRAWKCIQRHEGPWNDPHAPYYGGLQMDINFQRLYGAGAAAAQGHGRQLDAARADLGRRAGVPLRPRLLPLAEHGPRLRPHLTSSGPASASTGSGWTRRAGLASTSPAASAPSTRHVSQSAPGRHA